jgi:hypothetical protein
MRDYSRHWLVAEKVLHRTILQRLIIVVRVDALLVVGERSSELHRVVLDTSWCRSGRAQRGGRRCWVHGVTGCGGGDENLVAAEVVAGERGTEVGGGSGTGVDMLDGRELPTPPAPSKWMYSTVKLSYVGVEPSSTALSHARPRPLSNTMSCIVRTRCVRRLRMR